jgi:hypothetical protein
MRLKEILIGLSIGTVVVLVFKSCNIPEPANNSTTYAVQTAPYKTTTPDIVILQKKAKWNSDIRGAITVYCVCHNNSDNLAGYVEIDASFFDKDGGILGTGMGNTTNFPAHTDRTIEVTAMDINSNLDHYTVDLKQSP